MTWNLFAGDGVRRDLHLPPAPPWRDLARLREHRATTWKPTSDEISMVNAALILRRPLLVTGRPGSGKSSLAYAVAAELGLGDVLTWPVTSRSTREDGLYRYDAIGRLRDIAVAKEQGKEASGDIGAWLRLGPLGTALATSTEHRPRLLLVDEIDKADIDFPNDLLHVLDEASFEIPELARADVQTATVRTHDEEGTVEISSMVRARAWPFVVLTSNGERDLPPAFLRRCLRVDTHAPNKETLEAILGAHLSVHPDALPAEVHALIARFTQATGQSQVLAVDQLLNAAFLVTRSELDGDARQRVINAVLTELGQR